MTLVSPSIRTAIGRRCGFLSALLLCWAMVAQADARHVKVKDRKYQQAYDVIQSVDATAHTVTIATMVKEVDVDKHPNKRKANRHKGHASPTAQTPGAQKVMTLLVSDATEIEVNGQRGDFHSLRQGMKVDVTRGTDETHASRLVTVQ